MCNDVKILPYCHFDGVPTLRDSELIGLYNRMAVEGLAFSAYPQGCDHWLQEMKSRHSLLYIVFVNEEPGGMLWLNDFRGKYAHVHLVVFKKFHGSNHLDKGRNAIYSVLNSKDSQGKQIWDGFVGVIPKWNRLAIHYALACGFRKVGVIPFGYYNILTDSSEPAAILQLAREVNT
jgi:hypothetical protein